MKNPTKEDVTNEVSLGRRQSERKCPRLNKPLDIRFMTSITEDSRLLQLYMLDISEGGMRVNTHEKWPLNSRFFLTIPLASFGKNLPAQLTVECEVRWRKSLHGEHHVHGLMFVNQGKSQSNTIRDLVEGLSQFGGRLHQRTDMLLPIEMELEEERMSIVVIRNLSLGGIGFRSRRSLKKDETLRFRLPIPGGEWVEGRVKIAWKTELEGGVFEYGGAFQQTTEKDTELINALIEYEAGK